MKSDLIISFKTEVSKEDINEAVSLLNELEVIDDDFVPEVKFSRDAFCGDWTEYKDTGLNTRDWILLRDAESNYSYTNGKPKFYKARLFDKYLQKDIVYTTGETDESKKAEVDHIVSLSNAYKCGAWKWKERCDKWRKLTNELVNLIAVSAAVNNEKSDKDASEWLPVSAFQKRFITLQIFVKYLYELSVTKSEKETMLRVLKS
ncbi:MAG: DUF1524 domain-containing protein [Bifidobacteriaceae bacterium]|jgi:hypothetical protein|nr:DUF1524 domain-containing protein [Bifidobacteriaceae bacterium]